MFAISEVLKSSIIIKWVKKNEMGNLEQKVGCMRKNNSIK